MTSRFFGTWFSHFDERSLHTLHYPDSAADTLIATHGLPDTAPPIRSPQSDSAYVAPTRCRAGCPTARRSTRCARHLDCMAACRCTHRAAGLARLLRRDAAARRFCERARTRAPRPAGAGRGKRRPLVVGASALRCAAAASREHGGGNRRRALPASGPAQRLRRTRPCCMRCRTPRTSSPSPSM